MVDIIRNHGLELGYVHAAHRAAVDAGQSHALWYFSESSLKATIWHDRIGSISAEDESTPVTEWLCNLKDLRAKTYWADWKRRNS